MRRRAQRRAGRPCSLPWTVWTRVSSQLSRQAVAFRQPFIRSGPRTPRSPGERAGDRGAPSAPASDVTTRAWTHDVWYHAGGPERQAPPRTRCTRRRCWTRGRGSCRCRAGDPIRHRPTLTHVPLRFPALQAIAESDALRDGKAERGEVDADRACERRHLHVAPCRVRTIVGGERADNRRRERISPDALGIDPGDAMLRHEPERAVPILSTVAQVVILQRLLEIADQIERVEPDRTSGIASVQDQSRSAAG